MRALVLGGTGLTGPFLVRRLYSLGWDVTVFHRGEHETSLPEGIAHLHGDIHHPPEELRALSPDIVVHMWALTADGALQFADFFSGYARRAVAISSCDVYRAYGRLQRLESGPAESGPLSEDSPLRQSRYPYRGRKTPVDVPELYDKVLVEEALRRRGDLPVTILRFPAVYGPGDYHRFGPWIGKMTAEAPEIKLDRHFANWRWTHGFAEDVAGAVALAVTKDAAAGRTYNVGEAVTPTWAERLAEWAHIAGWGGRIAPVETAEIPENERMPLDFSQHLEVDTSLIRRELGYAEAVPREEGIARTIAWERASAGAGA